MDLMVGQTSLLGYDFSLIFSKYVHLSSLKRNTSTNPCTYLKTDLPSNNPNALAQALSSAKVLQVIATDQPEAWYTSNATILRKLAQKGLLADDYSLNEALQPIFDQIVGY